MKGVITAKYLPIIIFVNDIGADVEAAGLFSACSLPQLFSL